MHRFSARLVRASLLLWSLLLPALVVHAQVRPPGGGGGGAPGQPAIAAPPGALVGVPVAAIVNLGQAGGGQAGANATYQWSVTGARLLSDPRAAGAQFVAEAPGAVVLAAVVTVGGNTLNLTREVTAVAGAAAGAITAPATAPSSDTPVTASVPPAENGDRTFRWTLGGGATLLSGQGTNTITFRPGAAGLKLVTCTVNLRNLVNVPLRSYLVATGTGAPVALTVNAGSGGGTFPGGSRVDIIADPPAVGQVFDRWTGDITLLGNAPLAASLPRATVTVPAAAATLTATYRAAAAWTPRVIENFNPQTQAGPNNTTTTVTTTVRHFAPPNAAGLVFLLHDAAGSGADWFERPQALLLARDLVAAGYGVAALNSLNRNNGAWAAQGTLPANLDALNHAAAHTRLVADGAIAAGRPVFLLGRGNGGGAAIRYADLLATTSPARPVKGAVSFLNPGLEALGVTSRVPQYFLLASNDGVEGAAGVAEARDRSDLLLGRGVASASAVLPVSPLYPERLRALAVNGSAFTAADAQAVSTALRGAGWVDENHYVRTVPTRAALNAALPETLRPRVVDIAAEIAVAAAERELFSESNPRVVAFLNARAADTPVAPPGRLVNLSTRSALVSLEDSLALGFNISGTARATLLVRGIGPALAKFGLAGALPAARLELNRGQTLLQANEGWDRPGGSATAAEVAAAAASVGAFALEPGARDAALLITLDPGTYTATIRGLGGATGDVLAEIYDVSRNATRLTNLSTLARINAPGDLLIPGIVIAGNSPRSLLIRAVAQGLRDFGLPEEAVLGDARISVLQGSDTVEVSNNWAQANAAALTAAFPAVGAFPLRAASDAALLSALTPGSYTLQAGAAPLPAQPPANFVPPNATGSVLVEVYEVP